MRASEAGQMECVKLLLDKGAEVNMQANVSHVINCVHIHVPYVQIMTCALAHAYNVI